MIENMFHVLVTIFVLVFSIHILVCQWIAIGHLQSNDGVNVNWIERMGYNTSYNTQEDLPFYKIGNNGKIYWSAVYFVTTTITTTGYGDISGATVEEKSYIIFLLFTGILIFTVIQHRTRQLVKTPSLKQVLRDAYDNALDFLF